jgi:hypothetical protein
MRNKNNLQGLRSIVSQIDSWIDRLIRSHKTVIVGFVTVLIILLAKNIMYLPGICLQQPSINIIDESNGNSLPGRRFPSTAKNPYFKNYVASISKHFSTKINEMGKCHYAELFFVYRPLISFGVKPFSLDLTKSDNTIHLDSPWVQLTLTNSYKLIAGAAFIWNERQFLLDQAVLSDENVLPTKTLDPIDNKTFWEFVKDYEDSVVNAPFREITTDNTGKITPANFSKRFKESQAAALSEISQRLPADIIWLLHHTGLGGDPPTGPSSTMSETLDQGAEAYINLTKSLLDRRFSSVQKEQHYKSILDLKDIFNINKYQINKLY